MRNPVHALPSRQSTGLFRSAAIALVCAIASSTANAQATVQNLTFLPSNGHWYGRVDGPAVSWHTASAQAMTLVQNGVDGHLMTPRSAEESFIARFSLGTAVDHVYWIGAYQAGGGTEPDGDWRWVTFEPWDYTAWAPGCPNNYGYNSGGVPMCPNETVAASWGNAGNWDDWCAASTHPAWMYHVSGYLVEFPSADIVITPGESDTASFDIEANGVVPPTFTMQVESPAGTWVDLSATPTPLVGGGTATASMPTPMSAVVVFDGAFGDFQVRAKGTNAFETVYSNVETVTVGGPACDSIDFNGDGFFPDTADIDDYLSVFSGGPCSTGTCGDTDFNNDGLFPDTLDIDALLSVFSGGPCL